MKFIQLFAILLVLISCKSTQTTIEGQNQNQPRSIIFSTPKSVGATLSYLASDELEGRDSGSKGIEKAAVFLENLMKENGLKSYFKTYRDTLSNFEKPAYNIVGYLEGNDSKLKNEFIIIGAHYDHIGRLKAVNGDDIGNGANDNASGSTAVAELIKFFGKNKGNKRSLLFVFFSAEEKGLLGSKHLAKKLHDEKMDLYFMFNFEMIGVPMKRDDMLMYITGFGKSNMADKINEISGEKLVGYIPMQTQYQLFRASDNYPFYTEFNVPAQTVSTFDFENFDFYHQPDDEFTLMNPEHMANVINKMIPVLEVMINAPTKEIELNGK
jgi:acetylornithine deacetylase/succinyl-diaminopimelate desuccinylase-like protein